MDLREKIEAKLAEIKKVVFEEEATEKDFVDAKTATGDILKVEPAIEVGAQVMVITEDGEEAPAPDGSYELEDGAVIAVESGIIANVETLEAPAEEKMSEETPEETEPTLEDKLLAKVTELVEGHKAELDAKIEGLKFATTEDLKAIDDKFSQVTKDTVEAIETIIESEATEAETKVSKNPFKKADKKNHLVERFLTIKEDK